MGTDSIRRDVAGGERKPTIKLPNLRLGFECKERWQNMAGDDHVRACGACDRPVFNLSAMTSDEAERLLATRGLTPCVRFYRRPDGTVMTTDCPTGERRERRRLAVVASTFAAGAVLATPSIASAEPEEDPEVATPDATEASPPDPVTPTTPAIEPVTLDEARFTMGIPAYDHDFIVDEPARPPIEWSIWSRFGVGFATQHPTVLARSLTPPEPESSSIPTWEAALAAEVTVGIAHHGNIRLGAWAELRTSSGPVAGGELVVEGLPPHPMTSDIGGAGTIVLRAGANAHVITAALGVGYVGAWPRTDPWIRRVNHLVGGRLVASVNRSRDNPHEWSATFGVEIEPLGVLHAVFDVITDR